MKSLYNVLTRHIQDCCNFVGACYPWQVNFYDVFFNTIVLAYSIPFLTHCYILHFLIAIPKSFMLLFECFLANCLTVFFYDSLKLPTVLNLVGWIRNKRTLYYDQPFLYSVLCPFSPTVYTFCFTCNKKKHFKNHLPSVVLNRLDSITKYRQYWVHIYC